jgi:hypothetical protein
MKIFARGLIGGLTAIRSGFTGARLLKQSTREYARTVQRFVAVAGVLAFGVLSHSAAAVPVTYILKISALFYPDESLTGSLGNVQFGGGRCNCTLTFVFEGDTANVISFTSPLVGHEILIGTASITVTDSVAGTVLAQGVFLPAAGLFVSIDDTNGGIGFGSFGQPPSSVNFPGQVGYPFAFMPFISVGVEDPAAQTYDLLTDVTFHSFDGGAFSCVNFPAPCAAPVSLPTTVGDLVIAANQYLDNGVFTAKVHSATQFSAFTVTIGNEGKRFSLKGAFELGATSNGINPVTEPVSLKVGATSLSIPPGSFSLDEEIGRSYIFNGVVAGIRLSVRMHSTDGHSFVIAAEGRGTSVSGPATPVTVELAIGDDVGSTTATALRDD